MEDSFWFEPAASMLAQSVVRSGKTRENQGEMVQRGGTSIAYGVWQIAMTQLTAGRSSTWRDTFAVGPTAKFTPRRNFLSYSPQSLLKQRLTVPHTDHFLPAYSTSRARNLSPRELFPTN
jgi:hypothetical protein